MPLMKKTLGLLLLLTLSSAAVYAQDLPAMEVDKNVNRGKLANGVEYFLVKNTVQQGFADIALAQKGRPADGSEREALSSLQHFRETKPYDFLARNGIAPESYGYMYDSGAGIVYRFNAVPMSDTYAADSTLMLAFDLMNTYPGGQAIVISGDIDVSKIQERMKVLSMMVPQRSGATDVKPYVWRTSRLEESVAANHGVSLSEIKVSFRSPRTDGKLLNTTYPQVMKMYASELGYVATGRLRRAFTLAELPVCDVAFRYQDASCSAGDELCEISFKVKSSKVQEATGVLATVLAHMDAEGVTLEEFVEAREVVKNRSSIMAGQAVSNSSYVDKCLASYLYGTSLTTLSAVRNFFLSRTLDPEKEVTLLNNIISAILSAEQNVRLTVTYPSGKVVGSPLSSVFKTRWRSATAQEGTAVTMSPLDTALLKHNFKKTKLKSEVSEPLTGGKMWTFANGIRVVYKKMDTGGILHYGLVLKGGAAEIQDLRPGESAFLADMPFAGKIAGADAETFRRLLGFRGISLRPQVTLSDVRIDGCAPSGELQHVFEALYAFGYSRKADATLYAQYKAEEEMRIESGSIASGGVRPQIDGNLRPDYRYSMHRNAANLDGGLPAKAGKFFDERFAKFNDGVLVIISDQAETEVRTLLEKSLGSFSVNSRHSSRARSGSGFNDSWYSQTISGRKAVDIGIAASSEVSLKQNIVFRIALSALRGDVVGRLSDAGTYLEQEACDGLIYLHLEDCARSGLPSGIEPQPSEKIVDKVRCSITRLAAGPLDATLLSRYKSAVQNAIASEAATPEGLMDYALARYAGGRDLLTGYKDAVKSVSASDVQGVLKSFDDAPRVEYISKPAKRRRK